MLAFIDESGDAGFRLGEGSSDRFTIAMILFEDGLKARSTEEAIAQLRSDMRVHHRYEFHFNSCGHDTRLRFLSRVAAFEFVYYGVVMDKAKLRGRDFTKSGEAFYRFTCDLVFHKVKAQLTNATVLVDDFGGTHFARDLQTHLKQQLNKPGHHAIERLKMQKSARNDLLQLADMVVGAISRSFDPRSDAGSFRELVRRREGDVELWP